MSSAPSSSSSAEICLLTAGCPIPRSFATAEKLPFSVTRTNICIASNLSTAASIFPCGIDALGRKAILLRLAFLFGIAGIPQKALSARNNHTSDSESEGSEQDARQLKQ